jgi:hypothetical protein
MDNPRNTSLQRCGLLLCAPSVTHIQFPFLFVSATDFLVPCLEREPLQYVLQRYRSPSPSAVVLVLRRISADSTGRELAD